MKYWIFQNNEVCGPHDDDDLAQLPGYSAETLVCPEGRKGTRMGDWQRAGMVPALAISLVKASQLTTAGRSSSPASAIYAGLPPEPTLKDLAALGSLQEKVSLMESSIAQFQEGMQSKETELLSLHREIDVRKGIEADLQGKLQELEQRLSAVAQLRETIDTAVAAEKSVENEVKSVETEVKGVENAVHGVESTVQDVRTSISGVSNSVKDIESALEKQRQTVAELMADIERLKAQQAAAPALPSIQTPSRPEPLSPMAPLAPGASAAPPVIERFPAPTPLASPPASLAAPVPAPPAPFQLDSPPAGVSAPVPAPPAPFQLDSPPAGVSAPPPAPFQLDSPPTGLTAPPAPFRLEPSPTGLSAPPAPFQLNSPPPGLSSPPPPPLFPDAPAGPALGSPFGAASAGAAPKSDFPTGGSPFSSPAKSDAPLAAPSLIPSLPPSAPTPSPAGVGPKPAVTAGPSKPKSGKKGLMLALVCFGLVAGGVLAFQAGLIPGLKRPARRANPAATKPLPPPAEVTPQAPSPEAQLDELKHQAIDLVKNWPSSDKTTLVGQRLEASSAPGGNSALSWMAEKLGEGTFQVNFYGGKSDTGKQAIYMFQANLGEKTVTPYNDDAAAKTLLFGEPPAAKGKKVRVKPKQPAAAVKAPASGQQQSASGLPVVGGEEAGGQSAAVPGDQAAASPDQAAPAPEPTKKPARKAPRRQSTDSPPAKPADDAKLLDQLLE